MAHRFHSTPDSVSPHAAVRLFQGGAFALDVREPEEFAAGHVAGATSIPLGQLARRRTELPATGPIVAICRSGRRSTEAVTILKAVGVPNVINLEGGMQAWQQAGLPVEV